MNARSFIFPTSLFLAVLYTPAWIVFLLLVYGIVWLIRYKSALCGAVLYDILYFGGLLPEHAPLAIMIPISMYTLLLALFSYLVRSRLRDGSSL